MSQLLYNGAFGTDNLPINPDTLSAEFIRRDELGKLYMVFPTGKLVRNYQKQMIRDAYKSSGKPLDKPKLFTFRDFAFYCSGLLFGKSKKIRISEAYRTALIEEAASAADLEFFSRADSNLSDGLIRRLSSIVFGLKEDGILPEHLFDDIRKAASGETISEIEPRKLGDIARIYSAYETLLGDKYADETDVLKEVTSGLASVAAGDNLFN